jgi:hypothetical protein
MQSYLNAGLRCLALAVRNQGYFPTALDGGVPRSDNRQIRAKFSLIDARCGKEVHLRWLFHIGTQKTGSKGFGESPSKLR